MGRASEELKAVKKKTKETNDAWPVKDKDYYVLRVKRGQKIFKGWLTHDYSPLTRGQIILNLGEFAAGIKKPQGNGNEVAMFESRYVLYPGPRPDKKWGPICP